jgi:hypothetical protein
MLSVHSNNSEWHAAQALSQRQALARRVRYKGGSMLKNSVFGRSAVRFYFLEIHMVKVVSVKISGYSTLIP